MPTYSLVALGLFAAVFVVVMTLSRRMRATAKPMYASLGGERGAEAIEAAGEGNLGPYRLLL